MCRSFVFPKEYQACFLGDTEMNLKDTFSALKGGHKPIILELPLQHASEDWRVYMPISGGMGVVCPIFACAALRKLTQNGVEKRRMIMIPAKQAHQQWSTRGPPGQGGPRGRKVRSVQQWGCHSKSTQDCCPELSGHQTRNPDLPEVFMSFTLASSGSSLLILLFIQ